MTRPIFASLLATFALTSCETMHNAAVSTFRVIDAPNAYVRRQLAMDEEPQTTTTTTTSYSTTARYPAQQPNPAQQPYPPGQPPPATTRPSTTQPPPVQTQRRVVTERSEPQPGTEASPSPPPPPVTRTESTTTAPRTTENPPSPTQKTDLPYARPVPGKPGYVFSPYDPNGGYVDVKGYNPGQKVKDPYSGKIFLVP